MLAKRLYMRACQAATLAGFCGALSGLLMTKSYLLGGPSHYCDIF